MSEKMSRMFPDLKELDGYTHLAYRLGMRHSDIVLRPQDWLTVFVVGEYHGERKALAVVELQWDGDGKFPIAVQHNPLESDVRVWDDWNYAGTVKPNDAGKWPKGAAKSPKKNNYLSQFGYQEP